MIRMKSGTLFWGLLLAGSLVLSSCSQDAVFYSIQYDKKENKNPAVPGSPGTIVKLGDALYVGSNAVYRYEKPDPNAEGGAARWRRLPDQPGGRKLLNLTGTDQYLYARVDDDGNNNPMKGGIYRKDPRTTGGWQLVDKSGFDIQSIYGAGDTLFAGARIGKNDYRLLYAADQGGSPVLREVPNVSGILKAAAYLPDSGTYYAALEGTGLLAAQEPNGLGAAVPLSHDTSTPNNFTGLLAVGGSLIAVSSDGLIWRIDGNGAVAEARKFNALFNGALAVWQDPTSEKPDLLLLGRAVSGGGNALTSDYGYMELPFAYSSSASLTPELSDKLQDPGLPQENAFTSISRYDSYYNTLERNPVSGLFQAPWDHVLFASTLTKGLWSCRQGEDPKEWNVEE